MYTETIDLYKYFNVKRKKGASGYLTIYVNKNSPEINLKRKRPAMLIIPGGAYQIVSDREKEPIALKFLAEGYNCFCLDYSVKAFSYPTQLIEGAMALAYIRLNAEELVVDTEHVCAVGFSAGGHLTACLATIFDDDAIVKALKENAKLVRPDAVMLSYPVLTSEEKYWHKTTIETVTQGKKSLLAKLSPEKQVRKDSSPAFIWHTREDGGVNVFNSILMASAYAEHGVSFDLHIYDRGPHGLSLATKETAPYDNNKYCNKCASTWVRLACNWLETRGFTIID
jgi:acetyl esterase/lipase